MLHGYWKSGRGNGGGGGGSITPLPDGATFIPGAVSPDIKKDLFKGAWNVKFLTSLPDGVSFSEGYMPGIATLTISQKAYSHGLTGVTSIADRSTRKEVEQYEGNCTPVWVFAKSFWLFSYPVGNTDMSAWDGSTDKCSNDDAVSILCENCNELRFSNVFTFDTSSEGDGTPPPESGVLTMKMNGKYVGIRGGTTGPFSVKGDPVNDNFRNTGLVQNTYYYPEFETVGGFYCNFYAYNGPSGFMNYGDEDISCDLLYNGIHLINSYTYSAIKNYNPGVFYLSFPGFHSIYQLKEYNGDFYIVGSNQYHNLEKDDFRVPQEGYKYGRQLGSYTGCYRTNLNYCIPLGGD